MSITPLSESMRSRLTAVLDQLIPMQGSWPGAGALGLAEAVWTDAHVDGPFEAISAMLSNLPAGFDTLSEEDQYQALIAAEASDTVAFASLWRHAINVYYAHPEVLEVVEQETGYPARPPLYMGYELPPFDEALLEPQKTRAPFWRKA